MSAPELGPAGRGLGIGFDLPWGGAAGFTTDGEGRDVASPRLGAFLRRWFGEAAPRSDHVFFSWQPRDRGRLRLDDYAPAWDDLIAALPPALPRALHHTALNLAAFDAGDRGALWDFTNALCARYGLAWINEDIGFWSVGGRPVPYPLPPVLAADGLAACVRNVRAAQRALAPPLVIEFPGFAAGVSAVLGDMDAYDFFRRLAGETGAPVNLDVAHLLSWRWWRGHRGEALYDGLDRLPLGACFEIHLSGCEIAGDRFIDAHHGRLLDEQLVMFERLLARCPNLRAVTFEDPRLDEAGDLLPDNHESLLRLEAAVATWRRGSPAAPAVAKPPELTSAPPPPQPPDAVVERRLAELLFDREARRRWREAHTRLAVAPAGREGWQGGLSVRVCSVPACGDTLPVEADVFAGLDPDAVDEIAGAVVALVRDSRHRGTGRLPELFPGCIAAWLRLHPEDVALTELVARFLASPTSGAWREQPGGAPGACVEACFAAFVLAEGFAEPRVCEEELLAALLRTLTVTPDPAFTPPPQIRRAPGGWFAVSTATPPVLHAALATGYLRGAITPFIAALLAGAPLEEAAEAHGLARAEAVAVRDRLRAMRLLPA